MDYGQDCEHCGQAMTPEPFYVLTDAWIAWQCDTHGTVMQVVMFDT